MKKLKKLENQLFADLINKSLVSWCVFGVLAMLIVFLRSEIVGWGIKEWCQSILLFFVFIATLARKRLSTTIKANVLLGSIAAMVLIGLFSLGVFAASLFLLPVVGLLFNLFYTSAQVRIYFVCVTSLLAFTAWLFSNQMVVLPTDGNVLISTWQHWTLAIMCMGFFGYFASSSIRLYKKAISELLEEVDEKKNKLKNSLHMDSLTGLLKLSGGEKLFEDYIRKHLRDKEVLAVMYLDLDGFRSINEYYGYEQGDWCLKEVAHRITEVLGDQGFAMRVGSDEFILIIYNMHLSMQVMTKATEILDAISSPIHFDYIKLKLYASAGLSFYPDDGRTLGELRRKADVAMHRAKINPDRSIETHPRGQSHMQGRSE